MNPSDTIFLLSLGGLTGLLAGFLGIGGGIVVVPSLILFLKGKGIDASILTHMAIGTSLATIIATGISSALAHHRHHNVQWNITLSMAPFVILGAVAGTLWGTSLHGTTLSRLFGLFEIFVAVRLIIPFSQKLSVLRLPTRFIYGLGGLVVGFLSALFGIGGGTLSVPLMVFFLHMPIKRAVGTSAALGAVIALFSTSEYIYLGWENTSLPTGTLGFVDPIPAVLIGMVSVLTAPLGARLTHVIPSKYISLAFASLLSGVGIVLIFG